MNQQTFQENGPPCAIDKLSVGKTRKQRVLSARNNPLISQIKGETKQNKVNTDVLAQVDGPICLTERNSCTNRRISTAPLSAACQHNTACNIQCHMTGYVFFVSSGLCVSTIIPFFILCSSLPFWWIGLKLDLLAPWESVCALLWYRDINSAQPNLPTEVALQFQTSSLVVEIIKLTVYEPLFHFWYIHVWFLSFWS